MELNFFRKEKISKSRYYAKGHVIHYARVDFLPVYVSYIPTSNMTWYLMREIAVMAHARCIELVYARISLLKRINC